MSKLPDSNITLLFKSDWPTFLSIRDRLVADMGEGCVRLAGSCIIISLPIHGDAMFSFDCGGNSMLSCPPILLSEMAAVLFGTVGGDVGLIS